MVWKDSAVVSGLTDDYRQIVGVVDERPHFFVATEHAVTNDVMQFVFDQGIGVADDDAHIAAVGGHFEDFFGKFRLVQPRQCCGNAADIFVDFPAAALKVIVQWIDKHNGKWHTA